MKVETIHYERTFNLGNYESVRLGCDATLEEGEKASVAMELLKKNVESVFAKLYPAQGAAVLNQKLSS